ncbi:zinc ribbon domain-containing protein [Nonomuraea aurantiaca]|uniref:zinc ribbon domain-containing protein n=1 Tax=Nonomuraea aurantiaca TaxID=2878562 RepID=UPI001CD9E54A|nr:zinc ribbon domain-containing protein [Nonomuraea aurantiaca]MCA2220160.1 transposase [Nonomuraea aurantiaca]
MSLWTPTGRVTIPYTGRPEDLKAVDALPRGEADLICRRGVWLLQVALTLPRPEVREPVGGFVGVDQGVANLAVTCDGVVLPGPAFTSQACPECGYISRANRPARGRFVCERCGLAGHADHIAARNIATRGAAGWAAINQPHATGLPSPRRDRESKPPASNGGS